MQFSAGSVLSRSFSVLLKNFGSFVAIALVVYAPVILVAALAGGTAETTLQRGGGVEVEVPRANQTLVYFLELLKFVAQYALAGAVAYGVFQTLRGDRLVLGDCLKKGIQRLLPVIGVAIVVVIGISAGFVLFSLADFLLGVLLWTIPAVILGCMWFVAVPAAVVEKPGVFGALGRSATLTKGNRMSIFAMFLLLIVLVFGVMMLLAGVLLGLGPVLGTIFSTIVSAFFGLYFGVCAAVAYHDLRVMKEGIGVEDLVKVFE